MTGRSRSRASSKSGRSEPAREAPRGKFEGFPGQVLEFYRGLARNNRREWFESHKPEFRQHVLAPAFLFVQAMGEKLAGLRSGIRFAPKVNGSVFRIHRDTRFSSDKRPYKTNLGIFIWEGKKRSESPGFYFHLEPGKLALYTGMHLFPRPVLEAYRRTVADPRRGEKLVEALRAVEAHGRYEVGGEHYKMLPRGLTAEGERARLLRHNTLWVRVEEKIPRELSSPRLVDYCLARFRHMMPVHEWLVGVSKRA